MTRVHCSAEKLRFQQFFFGTAADVPVDVVDDYAVGS
jgi:hypothetical protein